MSSASQREAHLALVETDPILNTAVQLVGARKARKPIADLGSVRLPASMEEAYATQDAMAKLFGYPGGWKIGAADPEATPMFAPMPMPLGFLHTGDEMPDTFSRIRGVEAEIAFLLRKDLPIRDTFYSRDEVLEAIGSAHPVIEVLESAYTDPDTVPRLAMIADLQMNGGFVRGPAIRDWQSIDIAAEHLSVIIDGTVRWEGLGKNTAGPDLVRLVQYLANEGRYRTGGLQVGQWITTGSWMGKLFAGPGSSVEARFANFGTVAFSFEK
jgi:2-keto-4-pentenoate hydratase